MRLALSFLLVLILAVPCFSKEPFAIRHPKLHKMGRAIRRTAITLAPIINCAGSAAQVGYFIAQVVR